MLVCISEDPEGLLKALVEADVKLHDFGMHGGLGSGHLQGVYRTMDGSVIAGWI